MLSVKINFLLKKYGPPSCLSQFCLHSIAKYNCKHFFTVRLFLDCIYAVFQYLL